MIAVNKMIDANDMRVANDMREMKDMNGIHCMQPKNRASVEFDARTVNEGFARMVVMGFMMDMNPTMDELSDVKTAVSEAVTNAIIHGYEIAENEESENSESEIEESRIAGNHDFPQVKMTCLREAKKLTVIVEDKGVGIADIEEARQPFFTTKPEMERSGMGFAFMESFMDEVFVESKPGEGTRVVMTKYISSSEENEL